MKIRTPKGYPIRPASHQVEGGGSNFVDATLRVVVKHAPGTMTAHKAEEPHGTTEPYGSANLNMSIAFSKRLLDAWKKKTKKQKAKIISGAGAGHNNHN